MQFEMLDLPILAIAGRSHLNYKRCFLDKLTIGKLSQNNSIWVLFNGCETSRFERSGNDPSFPLNLILMTISRR